MKFLRTKTIRNAFSLFTFLGLLSLSAPTFSQSEYKLGHKFNGLSWLEFMNKAEQKFNVHFYFAPQSIPDLKIQVKKDSVSLEEVLKNHFEPHNIKFSIDQSGNVFLIKDHLVVTQLPDNFFQIPKLTTNKKESVVEEERELFLKTSEEYIAQSYKIGDLNYASTKKTAIISGYIKNAKTNEAVVGASIIQNDKGSGIASNDDGYFSFEINKGKHFLTVKSLNSIEKIIEVEVFSDGNLNLLLDDKIFLLEDVVISAQSYSKVKGTQMGLEKLPIIMVKKIPLVFGESDVLKVALLLPGIQSVGEGSSGFNVRGSPTDQNIFYLNNIPIYNTSHVAGFFSAFNSDAIDEFSLYKNNVPIKYGGRLASVFDIKSKQGSMNKTKVNGGIGLITGRLLAEGPIKKDKSSYMLAFRSTYSDWLLKMVDDKEISKSKVKFADLIANFKFHLDETNHLSLFSYVSNDAMNLISKTKYDYQNYGASIIWNHYFKNNHDFELSFVHSAYLFNEENSEIESFAYQHQNKIKHTELKANYNLNLNEKHQLMLGGNAVLYQLDKGNPRPLNDNSKFMSITLGQEKGLESALYISDEWEISPNLTINGGLRYNHYSYLGPQKVYQYLEDFPKSEATIQDTLFYKNNENIKSYQGLDFRLAANYKIKDGPSFKIAYNRLHQYMYILTNTVAIAPNYKWKLTDSNTKPIIGDQFSIGIFSDLFAYRYEVSMEAYYKKVQNLVELKNGASLFLNEFVERSTLQGKLDAYGFEFMLKKNTGKTTGWINYTYSNTSVLIDSKFREDRINFGKPFPSNYDKPHSINMVVNRDFSKRFSMSANFVYSTGRPITYPTSIYYINGVKHLNYSARNAYRIPDYIRLDLSFSLKGNLKKRKISHSFWSFSIYNLLGRKNAYSVYFVKEAEQIKGYKFSVFGAPIYSLTYNFKLGNYDN